MYKEMFLPRGANSQDPGRIVIHAMAEYVWYKGEYLHAVEFLRNIEYDVKGEMKQGLSAHILVCPNKDIIRCRKDSQGAYHAAGYNEDSLGVEFLVPGKHDYLSFKEAIKTDYLAAGQYEVGMEFIRDEWVNKLGILRLERHSDLSPERKTDPGDGFPWSRLLKDVGVVI